LIRAEIKLLTGLLTLSLRLSVHGEWHRGLFKALGMAQGTGDGTKHGGMAQGTGDGTRHGGWHKARVWHYGLYKARGMALGMAQGTGDGTGDGMLNCTRPGRVDSYFVRSPNTRPSSGLSCSRLHLATCDCWEAARRGKESPLPRRSAADNGLAACSKAPAVIACPPANEKPTAASKLTGAWDLFH
jgi:hypothetical protein